MISHMICKVAAMPTRFENIYFRDSFGSLEWGSQGGRQKNFPFHTVEGSHDFGVQRDTIFRQNPSKRNLGRHTLSLGVPRRTQDGQFSMHIVGILCCDSLLSGHAYGLSRTCFPAGLAQKCLLEQNITVSECGCTLQVPKQAFTG